MGRREGLGMIWIIVLWTIGFCVSFSIQAYWTFDWAENESGSLFERQGMINLGLTFAFLTSLASWFMVLCIFLFLNDVRKGLA